MIADVRSARFGPESLPTAAWVVIAGVCVAIAGLAVWAGPLATLGTALAVLVAIPAVWAVSVPGRALAVYAFALPLDIYLSTTLRVTSTQVLQVAIFTAWMIRLLLDERRSHAPRPTETVLPYRTGALLVGYLIVSLTWSVNVDASARSVIRNLGAMLMAVYAAGHADRATLGRIIRAMGYGALVAAAYGYVQYARGGYDALYPLFSPFYTDPFVARGGGFSVVATFANPNILAGYLLMVLPLVWASCVSATGPRRAAWLVAAVLLGGLLLLTFSKASWLLGFALLGLWALARLPIGATFALGAAGGIVAGVILLLIEPVLRTLLVIFPDSREVSVDTRLGLWWAAIAAFLERPLLGFGLDGFAAATAGVRSGVLADLIRAHNMYFQALVDLGIVGSLLWWTPCVLIVRRAIARLHLEDHGAGASLHTGLVLSAAAFFLYGLVETLNISNQYVNTSWLVLGLLAASSHQQRRTGRGALAA